MNSVEIFLQNQNFLLEKTKAIQIKNNPENNREIIEQIFNLFYIEKTLDLDITDDEQKDFADFIIKEYKIANNKNNKNNNKNNKDKNNNKNNNKDKNKNIIDMIDENTNIIL
jgi:hypothetical protein